MIGIVPQTPLDSEQLQRMKRSQVRTIRVPFTWYALAPRIFPLSELDDQRLGALIMWVPGALVMWLGITFAYFRWARREDQDDGVAIGTDRGAGAKVLIAAPPFPEQR